MEDSGIRKVLAVNVSYPILPAGPDSDSIVADGSVDLRGRPVSRKRTGGWKACYFIYGQEVAERIAYYGFASNLVVYLTTELRQGLAKAAKSVNNWNGAVFLFPFLGAFVADAYLGRYWTILTFSFVYITASLMLTAAVSVTRLRPPECPAAAIEQGGCPKASSGQLAFFYLSLYLMAVGNGGMKPCVSALGADQFDEEDEEENKQKLSFNWWYAGIGVGALFAISVVVYVQDNVGWGWGYGIPTLALGLGMLVFLLGTPRYRHKRPVGSPLTQFAHVFVSAARKWNVALPSSSELLHESPSKFYLNSGRRKVLHTDILRFLDKAAAYNPNSAANYASSGMSGEVQGSSMRSSSEDPWRLCTVTEVEEVKVFPHLGNQPHVPDGLRPGEHVLRQASHHSRHKTRATLQDPARLSWGLWHAAIPLHHRPLRQAGGAGAEEVDRAPSRSPDRGEDGGGHRPLHLRHDCGGSGAEEEGGVAREHGLLDLPQGAFLPMSVFWLVPQYVIVSGADSLAIVGEMEFFYDQAPDHMKSVDTAFLLSMNGVGSFLSTALISLTNDVTGRDGKQPWIIRNLNRAKLDRFYWMLAVLSTINCAAYAYFAYTYSSRATESQKVVPDHRDALNRDELREEQSRAL